MSVAIGACYAVDGSKYDNGVYRVVGAGDPVAMVQIGDADGNRVHTGRVIHVPRSAVEQFEPAEEPSVSYLSRVENRVRLLPHEVRTTLYRARKTPVATGLSVGLILLGVGLDSVSSVGLVSDVVLLVGSLGLAASVTVWYGYKMQGSS